VEIKPTARIARVVTPEFRIPEEITLPDANLPAAGVRNLLQTLPATGAALAPRLGHLALIRHNTGVATAENEQ
jgi:hypothetical protein